MNLTVIMCAVFMFLGGASIAFANDAQEIARPFGDCRMGYWSSNRNLDDVSDIYRAACTGNWKPALNSGMRFNFSGQAGINDFGMANQSRYLWREAYLEIEYEALHVRAGRQIISWGRADRVNPSDHFSRRDYTLLSAEDEGQKLGVDAVLASYKLNADFSLIGVVAPIFNFSQFPRGKLSANLRELNQAKDLEWAIKLDRTGSAWDGAVSYYEGYQRLPRYNYFFPVPGKLLFQSENEKKRSLGVDFATTLGDWGFRAEAAASRFTPSCMQCKQRSEYRWVVGVDRDVGESLNLNAQLYHIHHADFIDSSGLSQQSFALNEALHRLNSEFKRNEYGLTFRVADRFLNDRLKTELTALLGLGTHHGVLRPRLSYQINDTFQVHAGMDVFFGKNQTYFGELKANRLGFVDLVAFF